MNVEQGNVLKQLRDIHGERVGFSIAQDLAFNPDRNKLVIMAEAGMGKTALVMEVRGKIHELLNGQVFYDHVWFEEAMDTTEIIYGPRRDWNYLHYQEMSRKMSELLDQQEARRQAFHTSSPDFRWIGINETVSVGSLAIRDRAISSVERMVTQEREEHREGTIYIAGPADPRSQNKAGEIRTALTGTEDVPEIPNEEVISYLYDKNIRIKGVENFPDAGLLVKVVFQKQARADRMRNMSQEILQGAQFWKRTEKRIAGELINSMVIPPELQLPPEERESYILKAAFIEYRMRHMLQLPAERGITVLNVFDPEAIIEMDMSPFIKYTEPT